MPLLAVALFVVLGACSSGGADPTPTTTTPATSVTTTGPVGPTLPPPPDLGPGETVCDSFTTPVETGTLASADLRETSGIVASRAHPDVLWAHNDSGDAAAVHAVGTDGGDLGRFRLTNAVALDWEDIAIGPGPVPGRDYLYLGDIGDNLGIRGRLLIHRIPEPVPDRSGGIIEDVETLQVTYGERDRGFDAEAMFVDPLTADLFIVTKRDEEGRSIVFRAAAGELGVGTVTLMTPIAVLDLGPSAQVTAADITVDGGALVLRGYDEVWIWVRTDIDVATTFDADPCLAPSPDEIQGEAVAFEPGGGYYTIGEGTRAAVNYIGRP